MEIFKTREQAEAEKRTNPKCNLSDMIVKVKGGFAVMTARNYLNWLIG